ncbi:molybdate ABC transporter substrate-binding protein [Acinetobacter puyangensis]|uniref:Molybdate transport system substrate-binding protein n=2 Tax=Acinetobacter puyangensis TaxID=1096779 RepID=A0A240E614_9GAMM|nr:molybdate transport system substrate-binding protein [Acinetobacter puyangensis]
MINFKLGRIRTVMIYGSLLCIYSSVHAAESVTIYAAASLTNAVNDLEKIYEQKSKVEVKTSYAASSTLAKQIEAGAPANVFMSADLQWADYLQNKKLIDPKQRVNLLGNKLVLIAPKNQNIQLKIEKGVDPTKAFTGRLCTGNVNSVPVGKYAKQALTSLDWWSKIQPRLVETEDVRGALAFVERGECQLGIVYATDAAVSSKVKVVGEFPLNSYPPVVYPLAIVKKTPQSIAFYQFLQSPQAKTVYKKYGFTILNQR